MIGAREPFLLQCDGALQGTWNAIAACDICTRDIRMLNVYNELRTKTPSNKGAVKLLT